MRKKKCGNKRLFYRSFFLVHPFSFLSFFQKKRRNTHTQRKWLTGEAKEKERRKWKGRATEKRSRVERMLIQAPTPSPTSTFLIHQPLFPRSASLNGAFHSPLSLSLLHFYLFFKNCNNIILFYSIPVSRVNGVMNTWSSRRELSRRMVVSAADDQSNSTANSERKRFIVHSSYPIPF